MMDLERLDRRAFLQGMMVTSAGLVVPKPVSVFVPERLLDPMIHVPVPPPIPKDVLARRMVQMAVIMGGAIGAFSVMSMSPERARELLEGDTP